MEKHIQKCLLKHLQEHSPISDNQWGFSKGKSTTGALLTAVDNWHRSLESGNDVCVVFFDLRKAFDSVPHNLLLNKLAEIKGNWKSRKAGTGTGTENWEGSSGALMILVRSHYRLAEC